MTTTKTKIVEPRPLGPVLVTGGCGFLGSHLVSLLLARYNPSSTPVSVLDIRTIHNTYDKASYYSCDITSPQSVRDVLTEVKPHVIIHTASPTVFGATGRTTAKKMMYDVNVEGTRVLVEEAKKVGGVKALVHTSSGSVVGDTKSDLINADERWRVIRGEAQREYYSETKAQAEQHVLESNSRSSKFLTVAVRPAGLFGERDVQLVPPMLDVYKTKRTRYQLGNNENLYEFTYAPNAAHAHLLAAEGLVEMWQRISAKSTDNDTDDEKSGAVVKEEEKEDEEEDKIDGEAFFITNQSPVYFWDFPRSLWTKYHNALSELTKSSQPRYPLPPAPAMKYTVMAKPLAIVLATIVTALSFLLYPLTLLGLGHFAPRFTPPQVRYACMVRYFRCGKAVKVLGYEPMYTLDEALSRTARWFAERDVEEWREGLERKGK